MYKAIIAKVTTKSHPNANNIQLGLIRGNQVVIGKDIKDGDLMVFFPSDGQLSEKFTDVHDLVTRMDENGKKAGGYFAKNRRVRAQNFRGEKSDGFAMPVSCLAFTGIDLSLLTDGFEFDTVNGIQICQKYYTPATMKQMSNKALKKEIAPFFKEHFETEQLTYKINEIPTASVIYISEKCHGTSHRITNTLVDVELNPFQRLWNCVPVLPKFPTRNWKVLHGSRRVILGDSTVDSYYQTNFRQKACGWLNEHLKKGETLYLEIVGWANETETIMPSHNAEVLKDKSLVKQYGKQIRYLYGNKPGECSIYVYRITMMNEDGQETELSWNQVVARCKELGINNVPELTRFIHNGDKNKLQQMAEELSNGPSVLDGSHIKEGVCIRIEHPKYFSILKYKSFPFKVMEGIVKDDDSMIDIEESS